MGLPCGKSRRHWTLFSILYVAGLVYGNALRPKRQVGSYWNWFNTPNRQSWLDPRRVLNNPTTRSRLLTNWNTGTLSPVRQTFSPSGFNNRGPLLAPRPLYNPGMFNNPGWPGMGPVTPNPDPTDAPEFINGVWVTEPPDPTDPPEIPPGSNVYNPWYPWAPGGAMLEPTEPPDPPDLPDLPPTTWAPVVRVTAAPTPAPTAAPTTPTPFVPQAGPNLAPTKPTFPQAQPTAVSATTLPILQVGPWGGVTTIETTHVNKTTQQSSPQPELNAPPVTQQPIRIPISFAIVRKIRTTAPTTLHQPREVPISVAIFKSVPTTAAPVAKKQVMGSGLYSPWALGSNVPNTQTWQQLFWNRLMLNNFK